MSQPKAQMKRTTLLLITAAMLGLPRIAFTEPVPKNWDAWTENILSLEMLDEYARALKLSTEGTQWLVKRSGQARAVASVVLAKIQRGEEDGRDPKQFGTEIVLAEMSKQAGLADDHARLVQAMQSPQGLVRALHVRVARRWGIALYARTINEDGHRTLQDVLQRCRMLYRTLPSEPFENPAEKPKLREKLEAIEKVFRDRLPKPLSENDAQLADDIAREFQRTKDAVQ